MKKGFTLLEMVLVLSVVVALFLLTIPNITKTQKIVQDKGCEAMLKVVDAAILQYELKYDQKPNHIDDLIKEGLLYQKQSQCQNGKAIVIKNGQASE